MADGYDRIDYENDLRRQREANPIPDHPRKWCQRRKDCPWHFEWYSMTGRIKDIGQSLLAGGGGSYHNPDSVTIGYGGGGASGGVGGSYSVRIPSVEEVLGPERTAALRRYSESLDVDYPSVVAAVDLGRTESTVVYERRNMNRRETIKARMRQLEEELAKIDRFPKDTFENGTILRFNKLFDISWEQYDRCEQAERESITVYSYAAIKANGYWYCSGQPSRSPQRAHWDALIEWMGDGVKELWLMGPEGDLLGSYGQENVPEVKAVEPTPAAEALPTEDLSRSYQDLGD